MVKPQNQSRTRLLDATIKTIRTRGYSATRIEDVCAEAQLTKGSFFHHFKSKEDLALAAAAHWDERAAGLFADAPFRKQPDPLARLLAYVDFRKSLLTGDIPEFTCLAGTIVQETYRTQPELSEACGKSIRGEVEALEADIRQALKKYGRRAHPCTPESLARHMVAVTQGGFILAKITGSAAAAAESLAHLRRYLELLFSEPGQTAKPRKQTRAKGSAT
jgi:TetR/AcrR family transcriptional repressor of nem operon